MGSGLLTAKASNLVSGGSCLAVSDSISSNANILPQIPCSSSSTLVPASSVCRVTDIPLMEKLMGQILEELLAIKLSQEEARRETKDKVSQLNTHLTHLSTQASQGEQRVSDLEYAEKQLESVSSQIQWELEELQLKLDKMENRCRRSNLRIVGVPEEIESASSVTKVVSDLIYKCIFPEKARTEEHLSFMRAHRVPFTRPANSKYPRTILVNFGDFRIKEQILSQAIKMRNFPSGDSFSFRVFSDVSLLGVYRCRKFVGLIDFFKR
ncbi:hypothetical protein NDU88_003825 [Pleurodeles waltl]|uniref:L1 transposable element RRM domain-containing protein n=1 Tax=Pleurodeles waltl TaxID=8319 RepID=A0AAV7V3J9_PLEWA|nr:hypothetical protein NDU88_003825 [Pleurodeles waltl]